MLTLTVLNGQEKGRAYQLTGEQAELLGRQAPTIKLSDAQTSRRHAEIILENNTWLICDLGSTNGTWVNGQKITQITELEPGDRIVVGRHQLRVAKISDLPAPKPQPKPPQAEPVVGNEDLAAMGVDLAESLSADILEDEDLRLPDLLDGLDSDSDAEQSLKEDLRTSEPQTPGSEEPPPPLDAQSPNQPEQTPAPDATLHEHEAPESADAEQAQGSDQKPHEQTASDQGGVIDLDALLREGGREPLASPDLPDAPPTDTASPRVTDQLAAEEETASPPADARQPVADSAYETGVIDLDAQLGLGDDQNHDQPPPQTPTHPADGDLGKSASASDAPRSQDQPLSVADTPDAEVAPATEADHEHDPPASVEDADAQVRDDPLEEPAAESPADELGQDQPGESDSLSDLDVLGSAEPTWDGHRQEAEPGTGHEQMPAPRQQTPDAVEKDQTPPSPQQDDTTSPASVEMLPQDDNADADDIDVSDLSGLDTSDADMDALTPLMTGNNPEPPSSTPDPQDVNEAPTEDESPTHYQPTATVTTAQAPTEQAPTQEQTESPTAVIHAEDNQDSAQLQEDSPNEADERDLDSRPVVTTDTGDADTPADDLDEAERNLLLSPDEQAQALAGYKRSRWKTLVMLILTVTALGVGGWYALEWYGNSANADSQAPEQPTQSTRPNPQPPPTSNTQRPDPANTALPSTQTPWKQPEHDAATDDLPDPLEKPNPTSDRSTLPQKPSARAQTPSPTPPDTHTQTPPKLDDGADPFADVPSYITDQGRSAGASAGLSNRSEPVARPGPKQIAQADPPKTDPAEPSRIDLLGRTAENSTTITTAANQEEILELLAGETLQRPGTDVTDQVVFANARKVAFVVDASGSLVDSFPHVLARLGLGLSRLHEDTAFTVIFFGRDGAVEPPPAGLRWASQQAKRNTRQWVAPASGNIAAWGRGDPTKALELALSYHVDEVHILSDNLLDSRAEADDAKRAADHIIKMLDGRVQEVDIVQFYDRDPHGVLVQIASQLPGSYERVQP